MKLTELMRNKLMAAFKTAGALVLYNPDGSVISNIGSYIDDLDMLFVVDNSESADPAVLTHLKKIPGILYVKNDSNLGIAAALNICAEKAIQQGCDFLFTIDQDSRASENMIASMFEAVKDEDIDSIGIISPVQRYSSAQKKTDSSNIEQVLEVMTSGNLLNLRAYERVGPFLDKLFIDYVDVEYCLRLNHNSYRVIRVNSAELIHRLGSTEVHRWCGIVFPTTNHPPLRRYYIARNRLYVFAQYRKYYPEYCRSIIKAQVLDMIKVIVSETEKWQKIIMSIKGFFDVVRGRYGKYSGKYK